jgi:DNA-binding response OmpR family regulator
MTTNRPGIIMTNTNDRDKILIVDDNKRNIQVLAQTLENSGYSVIAAMNGTAALECAMEEGIQLILLDIMMPKMDGMEVCRRLKYRIETKDIPVIFLTAKVQTDDIVAGFEIGAADYVTKPFQAAELFARVKTHIGFKKARERIESLVGLIPICCECKKIRNDDGFWNQVEVYISEHSRADFTHSYCPDCLERKKEEIQRLRDNREF